METQKKNILKWLKSGRSITPMQALRQFGSFRLGARIWELRNAGYRIDRVLETDGRKRWARYTLIKQSR